jgi:hypothetical protein
MRSNDLRLISATIVLFLSGCFLSRSAAWAEVPRVYLLDGDYLHSVRTRVKNGDHQFDRALESLRHDADRALSVGPFSVVNKDTLPPSGDKHDYMSFAPYWWPNPGAKDGLPYIQRDGERNPDIYKTRNRSDLGAMTETVETLSLAYYFTRDEKYSSRARLLIRNWFLEPSTRMNPNFEFAQAIRGVNTGRGLGLIESRLFTKVVDAVGLLADSRAWTQDDERALKQWYTSYLQWMLSSEHGREEASAKNNHGTYYDVQVASFALFIGKEDLAKEVIEAAKNKRIAVQIEPDGRQPLELVRTKAWSYSIGNLSGLMSLAQLGERVDVDFWNYETSDHRSIRAALDFLVPFAVGTQKWPYQQIGGFSKEAIYPLLRRAAATYQGQQNQSLLLKLPPNDPRDRSNLLWVHGLSKDIRVSSLLALANALANAAPGDKIVVDDGVYENSKPLRIASAGTKWQPIEISAASIGGVEINGKNGFTFSPGAAYVVLRGFKFRHEAGTVDLPPGTHHCRITRNVFELNVPRMGAYLIVSGDDNQIDYNCFQNKNTEGQMLMVAGPAGPAMAQRTWIHHNLFRNFESTHGNNASALHIGASGRSLSAAHTLVEHNLFLNTRGENEGAICNKSCENTYRFNTIGEGCTELSLRHGNACMVYGNSFLGTRGGLRIFGDDHKIFSNYFENNQPAVQIGNGDGNVPPAKLTSHDRPDRVQFVFNTLVDNPSNIVMSRRKQGLGATDFVIANNIILRGGPAASIDGPFTGAIWEGNILWPSNKPAGTPNDGYTSVDPQLGDGCKLLPRSPAIGRAVGLYPYANVDLAGQKRATKRDVGAHQFSAAEPSNSVLTVDDVGPQGGGSYP